MTSSIRNIFRVTGHLCGEFTGPRWISRTRPVTRSFDVFFYLCLNKRLSKQSWGLWFETLSRSSWRHRNGKLRWHHWKHTVIFLGGVVAWRSYSCHRKPVWLVNNGSWLHHYNVIKLKHFPRYWSLVQGIHRSPVNFPHKGLWSEFWCFLWATPE